MEGLIYIETLHLPLSYPPVHLLKRIRSHLTSADQSPPPLRLSLFYLSLFGFSVKWLCANLQTVLLKSILKGSQVVIVTIYPFNLFVLHKIESYCITKFRILFAWFAVRPIIRSTATFLHISWHHLLKVMPRSCHIVSVASRIVLSG